MTVDADIQPTSTALLFYGEILYTVLCGSSINIVWIRIV